MDGEMAMPSKEELEETFIFLQTALVSLPHVPTTEEVAPGAVFEGARWVHDWTNMDAELAQLTSDSSQSGDLVSVRSNTALRHISFETEKRQIDIEIEPAARGVSLTGSVSPATTGTVRAVVGSISHSGAIDEAGTFLIDNVNHGVVMAFIETDAGTIRLGSFEV